MARKTNTSARVAVPAKAPAKPAAKALPAPKAAAKPAVKAVAAKAAPTPPTKAAPAPKAAAMKAVAAPAPAPAPAAKARKPDNGKIASLDAALASLGERGAAASDGGAPLRADALADAQAARALAAKIGAEHKVELERRGLSRHLNEAAVQLAQQIESHLQSLGAATRAARERGPDEAEMLSEAALFAHSVREAVARVSRGTEGRFATHAFGLGEAFNVRQPAHVLRALQRIVAAAKAHPAVAADAGLIAGDLENAAGLAAEVARLPGAAPTDDASEKLHRSHAALRAWFDLVAAKVQIGLSGDPEERTRLLALIPRGHERRHHLRRME
jgi:hypothetical protein